MAAPIYKTYSDSGVDIDAGDRWVKTINQLNDSGTNSQVLSGIGGFASLFRMPQGYNKPVLVAATDGVGSKLLFALQKQNLEGIGVDLVAMCANDLLVSGARALFFLDYFACAKLDENNASAVIRGIVDGCKQAQCVLVGGETAEMPGLYRNKDFDLAGFCVGVVEEEAIKGKHLVADQDLLIAIGSTGAHANGYSLIRNIVQTAEETNSWGSIDGLSNKDHVIKELLKPTLIYSHALQSPLFEKVHALAHITGGGLAANLMRVLPTGATAVINHPVEKWPAIFRWLQQQGPVATSEMRKVFNCGIGMVLCIAAKDKTATLEILKERKLNAWPLGYIELKPSSKTPTVILNNND